MNAAALNFLVVVSLVATNPAEAFLLHKKMYMKMSSLAPQDSNCLANETLVLYQEPVIRKNRILPSIKGRCCPGLPQIEAHKIVGEVCPLVFEAGNYSLPEGFDWASSNDTGCPQNFTRPACCSDPTSGFCNIYHDRTPEGLICPVGKAVCCARPPGTVFGKLGPTLECTQQGILPGVKKTQRLLKAWMSKDWNEKSKFFYKFPQPKKLRGSG